MLIDNSYVLPMISFLFFNSLSHISIANIIILIFSNGYAKQEKNGYYENMPNIQTEFDPALSVNNS